MCTIKPDERGNNALFLKALLIERRYKNVHAYHGAFALLQIPSSWASGRLPSGAHSRQRHQVQAKYSNSITRETGHLASKSSTKKKIRYYRDWPQLPHPPSTPTKQYCVFDGFIANPGSPPCVSIAAMNHSSVDEFRDQYPGVAQAFIERSIRKNRTIPSWDARTQDQHERWVDSAREARSNVSPSLFAYAERRGKGLESLPGHYTWPERSKVKIDLDRTIRQLGITEPHAVNHWRAVDWNETCSKVNGRSEPNMPISAEQTDISVASAHLTEDIVDYSLVPRHHGICLQSDRSCGAIPNVVENPNYPKAKISIPPEEIKDNGLKTSSKDARKEQAREWEHDLNNPEKDTGIPHGFTQHPGRPWTENDEEQLLDLIEAGELDFSSIGHETQRTEDECHRKYRYLACLEVKAPRFGPWSVEQDAMLVRFVEEYHIADWDRIAFHCGTTTEAARQYWNSRKPATSCQLVNGKTQPNLASTSASTDPMMAALGDMCNTSDSEKGGLGSSTATVSPPNDGPQDDNPARRMSAISPMQQPGLRPTAVASSNKAQETVAPSMAPNALAGGEKRARGESDEIGEVRFVTGQPNSKARRTETLRTASASRIAGSASGQILRRSSRPRKGKRSHDSHFLWYDPHKTKSLSKKGMTEDTPPQLVGKDIQSECDRVLVSKKVRRAAGNDGTADKQSSGSAAPLTSIAACGTKRPHGEIDEHDDKGTSRRKLRRTDFPKVILKVRKPVSGAPPAAAAAVRPLRRSLRLARQGASDSPNTVARPEAGPGTMGSGRKVRRARQLEAETLAEHVEKK